MTERVSPLYCPYCAGEDLRPHGFVGLVVRK